MISIVIVIISVLKQPITRCLIKMIGKILRSDRSQSTHHNDDMVVESRPVENSSTVVIPQ